MQVLVRSRPISLVRISERKWVLLKMGTRASHVTLRTIISMEPDKFVSPRQFDFAIPNNVSGRI